MAATTRVKDVMWRVSGLLQDVAPQFNRWPETELVNWLNDAQLAITKFLPAAVSRIDAIRLKPGTRQSIETIAAVDCIPGDGTTPVVPIYGVALLDVPRNMGANGATAGNAIPQPVDRRILDTQRANWHTVSGAVVNQITYDPRTPRHFYVQPAVPASPAVWVEVAYIAQPLQIPNTGTPGAELYTYAGSNAATISVGDEHVDDLVNYICARSYMKNADFAGNDAKASGFSALFVNSLNAKVAAITGNNPNLQRLPLAIEPLGQAS